MARTAERMEESLWVRQAQEGSEEAFCKLVRLHHDSVRGFLFRFVRNASIMEDLAQETFLSAFRRIRTFREESSLRVWLLGIARLGALKYLREEHQRLSRQSAALETAVADWRIQTLEREGPSDPERELSALRQCLKGLPPSSAHLVAEYYYKGHSLSDLARSYGKRGSAMKMTLLRIREALRECVEQRLSTGEVTA